MRAFFCVLLLSLTSTALRSDEAIEKKIKSNLQKNDYDSLGHLLQKKAGKKVSLDTLQKIAEDSQSAPLFAAVKTSRKLYENKGNLPISLPELLETSLFIETQLPKFAEREHYYVSKKRSGLDHNVEYDPRRNASFIRLTGKHTHLGEGKKKTVTKAIFYNHKHPQVVACGEQTKSMQTEMKMTKKMRGAPGLFKIMGFGKHMEHGKKYKSVYSKMYRPGSLRDALDNGVRLSMYEKMRASLGILRGLRSLHSKGIVHRDLGDGNYLIDIPKGKPGKRKVTCCIADLGRAGYAKDMKNALVQARSSYTSPEGLFKKQMKNKDYFRSDVFAAGCALYRIFYGKMGKWQDISYVKKAPGSLKSRFQTMTHRIKKATKERRNTLAKEAQAGELSPKKAFEFLILRMLHTNPFKRGNAKELHLEMKAIFTRVK